MSAFADAPRAGSAEAKHTEGKYENATSDAPRAGSAEAKLGRLDQRGQGGRMHPVQAAPRQSVSMSYTISFVGMHPVQAAPRQRRR